MVRTLFFTIYGMVVGAAYATAINVLARNEAVTSAIWLGILVVVFGFLGYGVGRSSEYSDKQRLGLIPLMPAGLLGGMIGLAFLLLLALMIPVLWPFATAAFIVKERRWRNKLKAKGRFASLDDLRPRLDAGDGTLIEETGNKGPYHIWWTADDLFSLGTPPSTEEEFMAILAEKSEHAFNSRCLSEYLDDESGKALLTSIPARQARSGKLAAMFPKMRVAMIVRPLRQTHA